MAEEVNAGAGTENAGAAGAENNAANENAAQGNEKQDNGILSDEVKKHIARFYEKPVSDELAKRHVAV